MIYNGLRTMCMVTLMALVPNTVTGTVAGPATAKCKVDATATCAKVGTAAIPGDATAKYAEDGTAVIPGDATAKYAEGEDPADPGVEGVPPNVIVILLDDLGYAIPDPRAPEQGTPTARNGYRLTWSEEFNTGGRPDTTKWSHEQGFVRNNELQWYQPENAVVKDGTLVITGKREQFDNPGYDPGSNDWRRNRAEAAYTSASINTRDKFSFMYGMMEVRARIDTSMGAWPAIWTLGRDRRWPANGEVDVMEFYRIDDAPMIHANAAWARQDRSEPVWDDAKIPFETFLQKDPAWPEKFHVWKMVWDAHRIRLYLDEQLLNEIHIEEATCKDGFNPFRQPHYILLNLALGANGGDPAATVFPIIYEVDYVRVYEAVTEQQALEIP
jgi:beta-glucanase (GH16 family)